MFRYIANGWNAMSPYRKVRRVVMLGLFCFGLWALTPYLYDQEVNEDFPTTAPAGVPIALAATVAPTTVPATASPVPAATVAPTAEATAAAPTTPPAPATATAAPTAEDAAAVPTNVPAAPTDLPAIPTDVPAVPTDVPAAPTEAPAVPTEAPAAPTDVPAAPAATAVPSGPVALLSGRFIPGGVPGDEAAGSATIYRLEDGSLTLRLEEFAASNGPDLFVVLSGNANPSEDGTTNGTYLQLAKLKGNKGNQNYALPADVDLSQYRSVVIWCRAFDIVFGYATLQ